MLLKTQSSGWHCHWTCFLKWKLFIFESGLNVWCLKYLTLCSSLAIGTLSLRPLTKTVLLIPHQLSLGIIVVGVSDDLCYLLLKNSDSSSHHQHLHSNINIFTHIHCRYWSEEQVCISVGCVPPTCCPYPSMHCTGRGVHPSMHWAGGVCIPACTVQGVYPSMHWGCLPRGREGVCPGESAQGVLPWG